jgi:hypothetical protein
MFSREESDPNGLGDELDDVLARQLRDACCQASGTLRSSSSRFPVAPSTASVQWIRFHTGTIILVSLCQNLCIIVSCA